jgi:hypothetical protein
LLRVQNFLMLLLSCSVQMINNRALTIIRNI